MRVILNPEELMEIRKVLLNGPLERIDHIEISENEITTQAQGCLIVMATANLEVLEARSKPRIELGLQPLTETEAKDLIDRVSPMKLTEDPFDFIDTFLTLIYEQGYEVCKRVEKEVKKA